MNSKRNFILLFILFILNLIQSLILIQNYGPQLTQWMQKTPVAAHHVGAIASVSVVTAHAESHAILKNTPGTIHSSKNMDIRLMADIIAQLKEIHFKAGSIVKKGDILAILSCVELEYQYLAKRKEYEHKLDVYERLKQSGRLYSEKEFAEARILKEKTNAEKQALETKLQSLTICAPCDGEMSMPLLPIGEILRGPEKKIATIVDNSDLNAEFYINKKDRIFVDVGTEVEISLLGEDAEDEIIHRAIVTERDPQINEQRGLIKIRAKVIENVENELQHNSTVNVRYPTAKLDKVFILPYSAVVYQDSDYYVCKLQNIDGKFYTKMVLVDKKDQFANNYVISSYDIVEGDIIVCDGTHRSSGTPVRIKSYLN